MSHINGDYITSAVYCATTAQKKGSRQDVIAAIEAPLPAFFKAGQVVEVRAIRVDGKKHTASGYFNDPTKLAQAVAVYDGRAQAIYFTLNPVNPALIARANNRMKDYAESTTSDHDIIQRCWFGLDFDPIRPADISSSDEEHEAALDRAWQCLEWLYEQGWPAPFYADSGNGAHLLYAIDLPNDETSVELLKACLAALAARFDDPMVKVDPAVFNASRIWKLYGTLACKGDSIPERPHRRAAILKVPVGEPQIVSREQLEALAAQAPKDEPKRLAQAQHGKNGNGTDSDHTLIDAIKGSLDMVTYAQKHFPGGLKEEGRGEVRILGNGGLFINPEKGTWHHFSNGKGGDAIDLVGYVMYGEQWNHSDKAMFRQAVKEAAGEAGVALPTRPQKASTNGHTAKVDDPTVGQAVPLPPPAEPKNSPKPSLLWRDILDELPKPTWLIENEIPERGLTVLCGKSGIGKSFIMLDYAFQLARMGKKVVYVALEGKYGLNPRLKALEQHYHVSQTVTNQYMRFWFDPISFMNPEDVARLIGEVRDFGPCMVVIDTLSRAILPGDQNKPKDMQTFVNACQRIQEAIDGTLCVVHHSRKSDDVFSGAGNLFNSSDTFITIKNYDGLIALEPEKLKDAEPGSPRYMRLMPVTLEDDTNSAIAIAAEKIAQTHIDKLSPNQRKVLEALAEVFDGVAQLGDLVEVTEIGKGSLLRTLGTMKKIGYVYQPKAFGPYHLTLEGAERIGITLQEDSSDSGDSAKYSGVSPINSGTTVQGTRTPDWSALMPRDFFDESSDGEESGESASPQLPGHAGKALVLRNTAHSSGSNGRESQTESRSPQNGKNNSLTFGAPMPTHKCMICHNHNWQPKPGGQWVCGSCEEIREKDRRIGSVPPKNS